MSYPLSSHPFISRAATLIALGLLSSLIACSGEPEEELSCGPDTREEEGQCIPIATPEEVRCGDGTIKEDGHCIAQPPTATCGQGTVEENGQCVAQPQPQCGEGTIERDGFCLLPEWLPPCGPGTDFVEDLQLCVSATTSCELNEFALDDECVHFDDVEVDLIIPAKSNPHVGGEPGVLGELEPDKPRTFKGVLAAPQDFEEMGYPQQDRAMLVFDAPAGAWVDISLVSGGDIPLGFEIIFDGKDSPSENYQTFSPISLKMKSERLFLAPYSGTYQVSIAPQISFMNPYDRAPAFGGEGFIFTGEVAAVAAPTPEEVNLLEDQNLFSGNIADLADSTFRITGFDAYEVMTIRAGSEQILQNYGLLAWRGDDPIYVTEVKDFNHLLLLGDEGDDTPLYLHFDWFYNRSRASHHNYELSFGSRGYGIKETADPGEDYSLHFSSSPGTLWAMSAVSFSYITLWFTTNYRFQIFDEGEHLQWESRYNLSDSQNSDLDLTKDFYFYDLSGGNKTLEVEEIFGAFFDDPSTFFLYPVTYKDHEILVPGEGAFEEDDSTHHIFEVDSPGNLKLTSQDPAKVTLYDLKGSPIAHSSDLQTNELSSLLLEGHYLLVIHPRNSTASIDLTWEDLGDEIIFQSDGNDSRETATVVSDWSKTLLGSVRADQTHYLWKLDIDEPQAWRIDSTGPLQELTFHSATEGLLARQTDYQYWANSDSLALVLDSGVYYIEAEIDPDESPPGTVYYIDVIDISEGRMLLPEFAPQSEPDPFFKQWNIGAPPIELLGMSEPGLDYLIEFEVVEEGEYTLSITDLITGELALVYPALVFDNQWIDFDYDGSLTRTLQPGIYGLEIYAIGVGIQSPTFSLTVSGPDNINQ